MLENNSIIQSNRWPSLFQCHPRISLALGSLFIWTSVAEARRSPPPQNVEIHAINVEVKNVFDPEVPGENHWPFTWANFLHIRTRASVIRKALLMKPGDKVNRSLLEESERNLRTLPFVKDAKILEVPAADGQADLIVKTQDTWTTQPQVNFGSEGGQNHASIGFLEENFLGYGKTVSYFLRHDQDGTGQQFGYIDPQIGNSRFTLNSLFADTPFGNQQHLAVARPFYALETRAAGGVSYDHLLDVQKVFQAGSETSRYRINQSNIDLFGGVRINQDLQDIQRVTLHYVYNENVYRSETRTTPGTLPASRALSGPAVAWSREESQFIKETFVDKAERIEDINLGHQTTLRGGYSGRALGATETTTPFTVSDSFGFGGDGPAFALTSYGVSGRYNLYKTGQTGGHTADTIYYGNLNYYRHLLPEFPLTAVFHAESAYLQNPDVDNSLELGGDTGLRGFKVQSFTGNKTVLANAELRFFYPYEVLHLAYLGGAVFADVGQAQPQGLGYNRRDVHASIGAGFRFALTRSTEGTVYRVDVAYALGPIAQSNRIIVSITSGQGFQPNGNTFSKLQSVSSGSP
jgi:outer membrane protein assembly factor BamA